MSLFGRIAPICGLAHSLPTVRLPPLPSLSFLKGGELEEQKKEEEENRTL